MALDRLFELTEEVIKEMLDAEAVKLELDGDRKDRSFFACTVKMDESTYIRTPKLLLQQFLVSGPEYILDNLKEFKNTKRYIKEGKTDPL